MRICVEKATGKILEMQSHGTEGILIKNMVKAGYVKADIEERIVSGTTYSDMMADQATQEEKDAKEIEKLIKEEMREAAIDSLKKKNKLNPDGTLKK